MPIASVPIQPRRVETLAQGEHRIEPEILSADRMLGLRVVMSEKRVPAQPVCCDVEARQGEAREIGRESSKVESRIRPPALLEPIQIELPVDAEMDAVPRQCAVDRTARTLPLRR